MKNINKNFVVILLATSLFASSCKKDLNVGNPNQPTLQANVTTDDGLIALTLGGVYNNGLGNGKLGWLGNSFFSLPYGYSELLGDMVSAEASNQIVNIVNVPDYFILDDLTKIATPSPTRTVLRTNNNRASSASGVNPFYYHWVSMYALNNACNTVLDNIEKVTYSGGDADSKKKTIKAFCYWWKGYAYGQIGSMYYAGLINDLPNQVNPNYVSKEAIIAQSNSCYNQATGLLTSITSTPTYKDVMTQLIPTFCQVGNGGVLTIDEFKRNINTMLARNILVNKLNPFVNGNLASTITGASILSMTAADWASVKTLTTDGIRLGDKVFSAHSTAANGFTTAQSGNVAANATGPNAGTTFKVSERFLQNFRTGDLRKSNNFNTSNIFSSAGSFGTRYSQIDGGNGASGVYVYGAKAVGAYEIYMAGSFEENALMFAEANIMSGAVPAGVTLINSVRTYQGSGLVPLITTITQLQAMKELVSERRVSLVYRGLSFYDSRRWGWIYDISKGGGSYGNTLISGASNTVNTNATINYNFLDYWDVPADEYELNPPSSGSAPIKNPN